MLRPCRPPAKAAIFKAPTPPWRKKDATAGTIGHLFNTDFWRIVEALAGLQIAFRFQKQSNGLNIIDYIYNELDDREYHKKLEMQRR